MQSLIDTARHVNWIDILCVILFIRILYVAFKNGFIPEFFKLLGTIAAIYLAMHYCAYWAGLITRFTGQKNSEALLGSMFAAFVVLSCLGYVIGFLLRIVFSKMLTIEAHPALDKWGGIVCGVTRALLLTGLVIFALTIAPSVYLHRKVAVSYVGSKVVNAAPLAYRVIWDGVMSKLMQRERVNTTVLEASRSALIP